MSSSRRRTQAYRGGAASTAECRCVPTTMPWRWRSSGTGWPPESPTMLRTTYHQRLTRRPTTLLMESIWPSVAYWATPPPRPRKKQDGAGLLRVDQLPNTDIDGPGVGYRLGLPRRADRRTRAWCGNRVWSWWRWVRLHGGHAHRCLLTLSELL